MLAALPILTDGIMLLGLAIVALSAAMAWKRSKRSS